MIYVVLYLGLMLIGYLIAGRLRSHAGKFGFVPELMTAAIYALVLIMGLRMGINEQVIMNLGTIGLQSFVITFFCCSGSMLAIFLTRKMLKMDRYGNLKGGAAPAGEDLSTVEIDIDDVVGVTNPVRTDADAGASDDTERDNNSKRDNSNLKNTLFILAFVAAGMLLGFFVIARYLPDILPQFDTVTADLLVVFLCILLFLVGFDLGLSGKVVSSIKAVGIRVIAFPFAAIIGTLIFGAASCAFFEFSLKEGLAISAGFGWFTYAPSVISDAGSQYMLASAVSFMHNIMRETSGIILIPVMAKKFGYIEATSIPGVAAADICIPIVEKSCRQDTIVYSFTTGIAMCVTTAVLVPLFINL